MPKTVISAVTFMCPNGIGKNDPVSGIPEGTCRVQGPEGSMCPRCGLLLAKATLPGDLGTITVMGAEDIEDEFPQLDTERARKNLPAYTDAEKKAHRVVRRADIVRAIAEARKREYKR